MINGKNKNLRFMYTLAVWKQKCIQLWSIIKGDRYNWRRCRNRSSIVPISHRRIGHSIELPLVCVRIILNIGKLSHPSPPTPKCKVSFLFYYYNFLIESLRAYPVPTKPCRDPNIKTKTKNTITRLIFCFFTSHKSSPPHTTTTTPLFSRHLTLLNTSFNH